MSIRLTTTRVRPCASITARLSAIPMPIGCLRWARALVVFGKSSAIRAGLSMVKLTGFVNSTADFTDQPKVINGASDFLVEALGDAGRHARSAVSAASLPFGVAVEIEGIFEIR